MTNRKSVPARRPAPVLLLTGFLGSGKTTLLNRLLRDPAFAKTLVVINEVGEIGIDHDLVATATDDTIVELPNGCVCCSLKNDLERTLRDAHGRFARGGEPWFERVVIETTGLANPVPILRMLASSRWLVPRFRLRAVVTLVDALHGADTLDEYPDAIAQVAAADGLLLSKTDLAEPAAVAELRSRLATLNPGAVVRDLCQESVTPDELLNLGWNEGDDDLSRVERWVNAGAYTPLGATDSSSSPASLGNPLRSVGTQPAAGPHADVRATCVTFDEPLHVQAVDHWLGELVRYRAADLLRVKGIVNTREVPVPMVVHCIRHFAHPPVLLDAWPSADRRSRFVFVTRNLDPEVLARSLREFQIAATRLTDRQRDRDSPRDG